MVLTFLFGSFQDKLEFGYLPEWSIDKETWKFLSWGGTGIQSREVSSVFQEDTPKPAPILCLFWGWNLAAVWTTAQTLDLGEETWATFPALTGKPRATWEVSELRSVWVPSTAN